MATSKSYARLDSRINIEGYETGASAVNAYYEAKIIDGGPLPPTFSIMMLSGSDTTTQERRSTAAFQGILGKKAVFGLTSDQDKAYEETRHICHRRGVNLVIPN